MDKIKKIVDNYKKFCGKLSFITKIIKKNDKFYSLYNIFFEKSIVKKLKMKNFKICQKVLTKAHIMMYNRNTCYFVTNISKRN